MSKLSPLRPGCDNTIQGGSILLLSPDRTGFWVSLFLPFPLSVLPHPLLLLSLLPWHPMRKRGAASETGVDPQLWAVRQGPVWPSYHSGGVC